MMLAGVATLLTWSTVAAAATATASTGSRKVTAYVPRNAMACEWAATRHNSPKYCKKCNTNAKVGAAERVTVQIGGCGFNEGELTTMAEFTATGVEFFGPIKATRVDAGELSAGDLSVAELTVGDLTVTGTSTHEGLETFNGDIATDFIYSTDPDDVSVQIPGSGADSTQIGPDGKGNVCVPMFFGVAVGVGVRLVVWDRRAYPCSPILWLERRGEDECPFLQLNIFPPSRTSLPIHPHTQPWRRATPVPSQSARMRRRPIRARWPSGAMPSLARTMPWLWVQMVSSMFALRRVT
jgi:hypothetical protein